MDDYTNRMVIPRSQAALEVKRAWQAGFWSGVILTTIFGMVALGILQLILPYG